ncbi:MAG: calcium/sodium antiporter [Lachnospiraceae bacterium]
MSEQKAVSGVGKEVGSWLFKVALLAAGIALKIFGDSVGNVLLQTVFLVAGFVLLIKGADWFVEGASKIADKLGIPQLIIGLTIVAMGTSAPEAAVSITAALSGDSIDIAIGNVLGSNIMNILLILGVSSVICPLAVQKSTKRYEIPFVILCTAFVWTIGYFDGTIGRIDGVILLALMVCFLIYLLNLAKKGQGGVDEVEAAGENDKMWKLILWVILGGIAIVVGSDVTVASASFVAKSFGMSEKLIGLTIVAFGTSLPELITSSMAAAKKKADIAIGNIVGSNIFNILFVLAATAVITPLPYRNGATNFLIDNLVAIAAAVLLWFGIMNKEQKLKRGFGILMLVCYAGYFAFLLMTGMAGA